MSDASGSSGTAVGGAVKSSICCRCFQPSTSCCSKCKAAWYCGRACQVKDWELGHQIRCKEIRKAAAAAAAAATVAVPTASSNSGGVDAPEPSASPALGDDTAVVVAELPLPARWLFAPSQLSGLFSRVANYPPRPVGLLNPKRANSCFFNVVLQTLIYTRPFLNLLDALAHTEEACRLHAAGKFCMICAVEKHRSQVMKHSTEEGHPSAPTKAVLPVNLLRNLDKLCSDYQLGQQEDSHDTMKNLLNALDESWQKNEPPSATPVRSSQRTLETTPISQLFGGYLLSELRCANPTCLKSTTMFEFMLDLSLELIEATDNLEEMLESFSKPERLDAQNLYKCGHCSKATRARKQITVYQPPNVLMIQLKRFRMGMFGKVNKDIRFPLELSLRKYTSACKIKEEEEAGGNDLSTLYRLYAVIVHLDLMNVSSFGHYICYIRNPHHKEDWLRIDDDEITAVSAKEVLKLKAYILMYQRTTPFVSSDKTAPVVEVDPAAACSSPTASSPTDSSDPSTSPPAPAASPAAANEPVQCAGGCGFWGAAATGNMCSQCWRKHQEDTGVIERRPSPKPQAAAARDDSQESMFMAALMQRRMLAQMEASPSFLTDPQLRSRAAALRAHLSMTDQRAQTILQPTSAAAQARARAEEADSAASARALQLQQAANQTRLAALHFEQERAMASSQLPPNPLATTTTTTAAPLKKKAAASASASGEPPVNTPMNHAAAKIGRNEPCPCKSGRKYKACHGKLEQ